MLIKGGKVYDPLNNVHGEIKDIYISDGKVVEKSLQQEVLDATGMIVMPGGVDIHSHIAGTAVNWGRMMCLEEHRLHPVEKTACTRGGVGLTVPSSFITGYLYVGLGYTTVVNPAVAALETRQVHGELTNIPLLDRANLLLVGDNHFVLKLIKSGQRDKLHDYLAWLLRATGSFGLKAVNPGGTVKWMTDREKIIDELLDANEALSLPHALHLHCHDLGKTGNDRVIPEMIKLAAGRRLHLTHIQFYCYALSQGKAFVSAAEKIAQVVNANPSITVDVGQVVFGPAVTITADMRLASELAGMAKNRNWISRKLEFDGGFGVVPMTYNPKTYVGATQWLIGLELFLNITNPWQVFLTTDHPNGGPFIAYPQIIRLLMDKKFREETALQVNEKALQSSNLLQLTREYDLNEIAIITRAGPARALGLKHKGHLGIGADADVAIYKWQNDYEAMFSKAAYVIKDGKIVVKDGKVIDSKQGKTLLLKIFAELNNDSWLRPALDAMYSMPFDSFVLDGQFIAQHGLYVS